MRTAVSALAWLAGCVLTFEIAGTPAWSVSAQQESHAYFESLLKRNDLWKAFSLRDAAQLESRDSGGYAVTSDLWVTYDPARDTDRHRQDAAKVVVPAFYATATLTQRVSASDTVLTLNEVYRPNFPPGRLIKVDQEVMTVTARLTGTTVSVERGSFGSVPAPHSAGATLLHSTNSLRNQVRLPLGTQDGHNYFFVWDAYWTDSYVGVTKFNHKAFQFTSGTRDGDGLWLEPDMTYGPDRSECWDPAVHVATFHVRAYQELGGDADWSLTDGNRLGPAATGVNPLGPRTEYCVEPNMWVRFFVFLRQRANDYDYVDMWIADERREAVQVLFDVPLSVRPSGATPNSIATFWFEFNSSDDRINRVDARDLVSYIRNFAALRDIKDPRSLLVRPVGGAKPTGPAPATNIRIF
jgi:hypothetical protein